MVTHVGGAIEVNPHRLYEFGTTLGDDVHKHVKPQVERLTIVFGDGVTFGAHNPSVDLQAAAVAYQSCITGVNEQLLTVISAASALADSAQEIASRYASSDALANAKAKDVLNVFEATAASRTVPPLRPQTRYQ